MSSDLDTVLKMLRSNADWICRYNVGSAWFGDFDEWDRLQAQFHRAVDELKSVYGAPVYDGPGGRSPARGFRCSSWAAVERIAYWQRSDTVPYAMLISEDNGRILQSILRVCRNGDLRTTPR